MIEIDSIIETDIIDLGSKGEGIGKYEGLTLFVNNAIPGDRIRVKILSAKQNYATGKIIKLITPSENRIKPPCQIAGVCGSCQIQGMAYASQLDFKRKKVLDCLTRIGKIDTPIVHEVLGMKEPYHYRNKAQFPAKTAKGITSLGFYKLNSHELVNVENCLIQNEISNELLAIINQFITEYKITAYDEIKHTGLLRHVLIRSGANTGQTMVCLIINGFKLPYQQELINLIKQCAKVTSITINYNTGKGNTIMGTTGQTIWGAETITEKIGEVSYTISPLSFFQVNTAQAKVLYDQILKFCDLTGDETVFDLYCGTGSIALYLANRAKQVIGIELMAAAIHDAKSNAALNEISNAEFFIGKAEKVLPTLIKERNIEADVVILDPPRKGCELQLLQIIAASSPAKIIYVSCDPATLARDIKILSTLGFALREVQPVDMFPHTIHVECVALLVRED